MSCTVWDGDPAFEGDPPFYLGRYLDTSIILDVLIPTFWTYNTGFGNIATPQALDCRNGWHVMTLSNGHGPGTKNARCGPLFCFVK